MTLLIYGGCNTRPTDIQAPIPPAPRNLVWSDSLQPRTFQALQSALIEHDRLTGQQINIGIFKSLEGAEIEKRTHQIFLHWKLGSHGLGNGILLALFVKENQARMELGFGLSPLISDSVSQEIASKI